MRAEKGDDLLARDAHCHRATDRLPCDLAGDHVGVASGEAAEELEDGDLQGGGGVGVDAVVSLDDNVAWALGGGAEGGGEVGRGAEGIGVGGEGCG